MAAEAAEQQKKTMSRRCPRSGGLKKKARLKNTLKENQYEETQTNVIRNNKNSVVFTFIGDCWNNGKLYLLLTADGQTFS